jgi:hypothetical protein
MKPLAQFPSVPAAALAALLAFAGPAAAQGAATPEPATVDAAPMPRSARLVYRTRAEVPLMGVPLSLTARTETTWKLERGSYEGHLHTGTIEFDQVSRGTVQARGLVPSRYDEKRPMHAAESVGLDWARHRLDPSPASQSPVLEDGAQDRLSLQFQFAWLHAQSPGRFLAGQVIPVQLVGPHGAERWEFQVDPSRPLRTGIDASPAIRLHARRMAGDREETMEVWIAESARGLPVRFRMVDRNHSVIDSVLEEQYFE